VAVGELEEYDRRRKNMKELERKPVHHPQVIWRAVDDETLLLRLDTGQVSVLNELGSRVWELMDGDAKLADIVDAVEHAYVDVARERLEADVEAFVRALLDRDMLSWAPGVD
jgi:hypothetical protein